MQIDAQNHPFVMTEAVCSKGIMMTVVILTIEGIARRV